MSCYKCKKKINYNRCFEWAKLSVLYPVKSNEKLHRTSKYQQ